MLEEKEKQEKALAKKQKKEKRLEKLAARLQYMAQEAEKSKWIVQTTFLSWAVTHSLKGKSKQWNITDLHPGIDYALTAVFTQFLILSIKS